MLAKNKTAPHTWARRFERMENDLRAGKIESALSDLEAGLKARPPRFVRPKLAEFARRLGRPEASLNLLRPWVRSAKAGDGQATLPERVEYAGALIRCGAIREGDELLSREDARTHPEIFFLRAMARIAQWDYASAASLLLDYLAVPGIDPYRRQVARVNLAAGWVHEGKSAAARALLDELLTEVSGNAHRLLEANLHELSAQLEIAAARFPVARHHLAIGESLVAGNSGLHRFFFRKWLAILNLEETKASTEARQHLANVRKEAIQIQHWESARDLDFALASATRDRTLFAHLIFGTSFPAGKARYEITYRRLFNGELPPREHTRVLGEESATHALDGVTAGLIRGGVAQRLFHALSRDFYRPSRIVDLHSAVFPHTRYQIPSSREKIHQALHRLRGEMVRREIPLRIVCENDLYTLRPSPGAGVRLIYSSEAATARELEQKVQRCLNEFQSTPRTGVFSRRDFAATSGLTERTAQRYLHWAVRRGWLVANGQSRRYQAYEFPTPIRHQS